MSIEASRTADPVVEVPRGGAMGTWGAWLSIIVLAMFVAGLATAAMYLQSTQPEWPPEDIEVPARTWALLAAALAGIGAAALTWSLQRMRRADRRGAALSLAWSGATLTASVIALIADLGATGFRWDTHAYTSVYWSLTGFSITFLAVGVMMVAAVLVQTLAGLIDERRHLELSNASVYVWFASLTTILLLVLVHYLPAVGGGT